MHAEIEDVEGGNVISAVTYAKAILYIIVISLNLYLPVTSRIAPSSTCTPGAGPSFSLAVC